MSKEFMFRRKIPWKPLSSKRSKLETNYAFGGEQISQTAYVPNRPIRYE